MATTTVSSILLQNGLVLIHDDDDHVIPALTDILIQNDVIKCIAPKISTSSHDLDLSTTQVIDCTDKIISPGFVDTHHHLWQSQLRGRHGNDTLLNYFPHGNFSSALFTEDDLFWGQLAGCLEALDCGTTTVVDFSHIVSLGPNNGQIAIDATVASGLRSVFCFAPTQKVLSWSPFRVEQNALGEEILATFSDLVKNGPYGAGRVTMGFAFDGFNYLPPEYLGGLMSLLDSLQIPLITAHYVPGPILGHQSLPEKLEQARYLDSRFLMAHSSNMPASDVAIYRKHGVHFSTTPSTEFQMSMGFPAPCFDPKMPDARNFASLGVDCHSACSAYIPGEAKLALQSARAAYGQKFLENKKQPSTVVFEVEEAFNQATIRGARAAKLGDRVGSIKTGKCADLVVFDATSPSMIGATNSDPVAAIILNSSPKDIDTVIAGGVIRKQSGRLVPTSLGNVSGRAGGRNVVEWADVVKGLKISWSELQKKMDSINRPAVEESLMEMWHISPDNLVDSV